MWGKKGRSDARVNVARYQVDRMTPAGESAYRTHCAALRALLDGAGIAQDT